MLPPRSIFATLLFILLRLSPAAAAYLILDLSALPLTEQAHQLDRTIRLVTVLVVWGMTEGLSMLWIGKKSAGSAEARGYGAVALIGAFLVLGALQVFRVQTSQNHFLLLLTVLAVRGMSRSGWEQGRPHVALLTSIAAHSLLAALSMMLALNSLPWPSWIVAISVGSLLGAVEASWYGPTFQGVTRRWIEPVHRLSLVFAPLAITALAVLHALPSLYALCFALTPLAVRVAKRASAKALLLSSNLYSVAGIYVVFMAILAVCRVYS